MPEIYDRPGFEIEHIIARQHDGLTVAGNLALACFSCNLQRAKGTVLALSFFAAFIYICLTIQRLFLYCTFIHIPGWVIG